MNDIDFGTLCENFLEMEADLKLLDETVAGVNFWERVRFLVYKRLLTSLDISDETTDDDTGVSQYLSGVRLLLRNVVETKRNPLFASDADLLFYGKGRRKKLDDGLWWDIYIDPLLDGINSSSLCLERPYNLSHARPEKSERLRYTDLILYTGSLIQTLGLGAPVTDAESALLQRIESEIRSGFGVAVPLERMVRDDLARRRVRLPLYQRVLRRIDPEVAFLTSSYNGRETFVEACQAEGVPVVELQHGVITKYHMGYSYPYDDKNVFPDYFFSFGRYWSEAVDLPLPDDNVIPIGYPFLDKRVSEYQHVQTRDQVLIISQPPYAEGLSQFAVELSESEAADGTVVYKLHPKEYDDWEDRYPHLADSAVEISAGDPPLYELFAESRVQIGVDSTALYEGLRFGLETYILEEAGSVQMEYLLSNGYVTLVRSVEQYLAARTAEDRSTSVDSEFFFSPNPTENFRNAVDKIRNS
jgi:hypothetical protein